MTMTDVLKTLERRIDTVSFVVSKIQKRTFNEVDLEEGGPLVKALDECRHDLRVVQRLS